MSVYRMNTPELIKFVELYRDSELLWNAETVGYKDRQARIQASQWIAEEINIPGFGPKEVAQKIKNIRTTYKQELNKIMKSEASVSSLDEIYKPKVPWFEVVDSFLRNIVLVPPSLSSLKKEQPQRRNDDSKTEMEDESPDISSKQKEQATQQAEVGRESQQQPLTSTLDTLGPQSRNLKKLCKAPRPPMYVTEKPGNIKATCIATRQGADTEFDVWAKSLAMQLNDMEVHRALNLQLQIQSLLSNERMSYESSKATCHTSTPQPPAAPRFGPPICSSFSTQSNGLHCTGKAQWQNCMEVEGIDEGTQHADKNVLTGKKKRKS